MKTCVHFFIASVMTLLAVFTARAQSPNLLEGPFEKLPPGAEIRTEDGHSFLHLEAAKPGEMIMVKRSIPITAGQEAFALSFRARHGDIKVGKESWNDGRVIIDFKDANGGKLAGPSAPYFKKAPRDWQEKRLEFLVPPGAATLEISPALCMVAHGWIDFGDFVLEAIPAGPVREHEKVLAEKREEEKARRIGAVKPSVPAVPADQMPPMLRVSGNRIQTVDGKEVWLQGVNIPSLEWTEAGEHILRSVKVALEDWKANCIRLPVNERFWIGRGPYGRDGGAAYRQLVEDAVNLCAAHGAYLILDLHSFRAPEQKHVDFWKDAAARFANNPAVLFDLLNEPHDISWETWRQGGPVADKKGSVTVLAENGEKLRGFESVGMQKLLDTVRETGAKNIVVVGGLDWAYDLSGILNGQGLDDRGGNGIVYATHVYPWKKDWEGKFLGLIEKYPVLIGECGAEPKPMPFERPEDLVDPYVWSPDMIGLIQKHRLAWTAWGFHPLATPRILESWDYKPTPYWGDFVKRALAGEKFEMKTLR